VNDGRGVRVAVCCKGSVRIGLGHVTRARAVAESLAALGAEVMIHASGDDCLTPLLGAGAVPWRRVGSDHELVTSVRTHGADVTVCDMLDLDSDAFTALERVAPVCSLSPVFTGNPRARAVFHRSRVIPPEVLEADPEAGARWRADRRYAVIRAECQRIGTQRFTRSVAPGRPLHVAISMGGGDADNRTLEVIRSLREVRTPTVFWVLLGEGYAHSYAQLVEAVSAQPEHEIILARTRRAMWRVLAQCGLAILASGTTTYEAAYAGLPGVNLVESARARCMVEELCALGACLALEGELEESLRALPELLSALNTDRSALVRMHEAGRAALDKRGADRIAREIITIARGRTLPAVVRTPINIQAAIGGPA